VTEPPPSYPPPYYPPPPGGGYAVPPQAAYPPLTYRRPPVAPNGAPLAEFWERFVAYLLDSLIIGAILLIPTIVALAIMIPLYVDQIRSMQPGVQPNFGPLILMYIVLLTIFIPLRLLALYLHQVTYQLSKGQTVGKRVMKIKIINLADGSPMGVVAARKRWLLESVGAFLGPFAYLDGLWQLWDQPYRQCLHDKWAQTAVVKVPA
jgi:uncharacterized RDD family membrane protein YckC